jgi:membrane-bound ClpP family serine protease
MTAFLRRHAFLAPGLIFILTAIGLFAADRTGVYGQSNGLAVYGLAIVGLTCIIVDVMKQRLYLGVSAAIGLAFVVGFVVGGLIAEPTEWPPTPVNPTEYCLLTWQERAGDVCFKLVFNFERSRAIHSWTSKWGGKCGSSQLKGALGSLPKGSYVHWYSWPPKFDYPPGIDIDELTEFAKTKGINLQLSPALQ